MGMTYTDKTVTGSGPQGTALSLTVQMVDDTTGPQVTGRRWYRCTMCGMVFPRTEVIFWRGGIYGIPCTDYLDIRQLARRESTRNGSRERSGPR
jgi:hypothetical protein